MKTKKEKIEKPALYRHITEMRTRMSELEKQNRELKGTLKYLGESLTPNTLEIYSAEKESCIGTRASNWHRIVCNYEGNVCIGSPRPHWRSTWTITDSGFSLSSMQNEQWKGWRGQYLETNEMKYDELPKDVLQIHHNALVEHIKKMGIFYPCHIYDDINGEMWRP